MQLLSVISCCTGFSNGTCLLSTTKGNARKEAQNPVPEKQHQVTYFKSLIPPLMAALVALSPICNTPGGNIIQPGATLFAKDLQRNGVEGEEGIYRVTYYGKGRMPGFGENCTPRGQCTFGARLQDDEIKLLAQFVKLQADQGWPNIESSED